MLKITKGIEAFKKLKFGEKIFEISKYLPMDEEIYFPDVVTKEEQERKKEQKIKPGDVIYVESIKSTIADRSFAGSSKSSNVYASVKK